MLKGLTKSALRSLSSEDTVRALHTSASEITHFCDNLQKRTLRRCLKGYGLSVPTTLDGWRSPDIIWRAICYKFPQLSTYPLGEVIERALKKTVSILMLNPDVSVSVPKDLSLTEKQVQQQLRLSIGKLGSEKILELFLSQWFFELSIRNLRGERAKPQFDFGFWYHFSQDGYLVPFNSEIRLREELLNRCSEKAGEFLPYLLESLQERDFSEIERKISEGFLHVFVVQPTKTEQHRDPIRPFLNIVVGSQSQARLKADYNIDKKVTRFILHGDDPNVSFNSDKLEDFLGHKIHSLVKDLLDIGITIYMADLYVEREPNLARRLGIFIPVRHLEIWSQAQSQLERTVSFLARDDVSIHFAQRKERRDKHYDFATVMDNRCTSLLSGGLDSAAGAVWAIERGLAPTFVSHYQAPILSGIQGRLIAELGQIYKREFLHIGLHVAKSRKRKGQYKLGDSAYSLLPQHLRSFLFLALVTAVAMESKSSKVYMFENGPVALNPLFSEAHINTRTAHPQFLEYFRTLIEMVFGTELAIENPFCNKTKGEVASYLAKTKLERLVPLTNSCWRYSRVPVMAKQLGIQGYKGRHEGKCFPCIFRRVAVHNAGLWDKDVNYLVDIFNIFDAKIPSRFLDRQRDIITDIADFVRFCQSVKELSDYELLLRIPDFSVGASRVEPQELVTMYRRHAEEVLQCFRARSSETFKKVFASAL